MDNLFAKLIRFFIDENQLKEDITKLVLFLGTIVSEIQQSMESATGKERRKAALARFFDSVKAEGGLDLPAWATSDLSERIIGGIIDAVVAMAKGKKGNS